MTATSDILEYNSSLEAGHAQICEQLFALFSKALPEAEAKVWHGHPVWFIEQNPVAGYSIKKSGVQILFWSGQSFNEPGLAPLGKFKAAAFDVPSVEAVGESKLELWLEEARTIQWNYAQLPKRGVLEKLTNF